MRVFKNEIAAQRAWLPTAMTAVLCLGMTVGGMATAAESNAGTANSDSTASANAIASSDDNAVVTGRSAKKVKKIKKIKKTARDVSGPRVTGPVYKDGPVLAAPIPACSAQSAHEINKTYGIKLWDSHAFDMGDSIGLDYGCWRTNLAKYGFGFIAYNVGLFQSNLLNHYTPPSNLQQYNGQKPSALNAANFYLTYDLSRWGLPDGQLSVYGASNQTTNAPVYSQNRLAMAQLAVYGTALNRQFEYLIGTFSQNNTFQGNYIGGNVNNPLGASAANYVLAGSTLSSVTSPGFLLKYHFNENWYNTFDISRSTPGTLSPLNPGALTNRLSVEDYTNPTGLNFSNSHPCKFGTCYPSPKELFVDEIGYKQEATPDKLSTYVRATGYYSNTPVYNLAANNGSFSTTGSIAVLADQQFWQTEPGSPYTAYKGLYVGATFAYNPPSTAAYTQDYEFRLYSFGLFGRPKDQLAFSYQHLTVSNSLANIVDAASGCAADIICTRHGLNLYNLTYTANIVPGVYATLGATYDDHPGVTWSPLASNSGSAAFTAIPGISQFNIQHALFLNAALVTVF